MVVSMCLFTHFNNQRVVCKHYLSGLWDQGVFPHFCDTRESPPFYGELVFGKPFLLYHRSGHFPQPCIIFTCANSLGKRSFDLPLWLLRTLDKDFLGKEHGCRWEAFFVLHIFACCGLVVEIQIHLTAKKCSPSNINQGRACST